MAVAPTKMGFGIWRDDTWHGGIPLLTDLFQALRDTYPDELHLCLLTGTSQQAVSEELTKLTDEILVSPAVLRWSALWMLHAGTRRLLRRDGRVDYWLKLIDRYAPGSSRVIEVGCAPGVLLAKLLERGFACLGVELTEETAAWVRETDRVEVRTGLFPDMELPACDLLLALNVLEHSRDPLAFIEKASGLLLPGGIVIIQTAIDRYDYTPSFGDRFDGFDDVEHLFLFTDRAMSELASRSHLDVVSLDERLWLLGEVAVFRKPLGSLLGNHGAGVNG